MKEIGTEESKEIQIGIMKFIHDFCVKNNIRYSLAYGSAIGAIRHKGFIPWDDDIDIMLLREDYNRFITLFCLKTRMVYTSCAPWKMIKIMFYRLLRLKTQGQ